MINKPQSNQWICLHNHHYERLAYNQTRPTPLTHETIAQMYHEDLRDYFKKYPDQLTDYYTNLLSKANLEIN